MKPCPHCGERDASKRLGHEVPGVYDGVLFWQCETCGKAWSRDWSGCGVRRQQVADSYVLGINTISDARTPNP